MFNYVNFLIFYIYKLIKKTEKRFNISFFFIDPLRILHIIIERLILSKIPDKGFYSHQNYFLKKTKKKSLIIISAGIGTDASFEAIMAKKNYVKKVIAIDPTLIGKQTIKKIKSNKIFFEKKALYINNNKIRAFVPFDKNINLSIDNLYNTRKYIYLQCINIKKIIKKYKIKKIDILKLDIEGIADKVIIDCVKNIGLPSQITFELERPYSLLKQIDFFKRFICLVFLLKKNYKIYYTGKKKLGFRSEILALIKSN
jgi:hypothetical protein